MRPVPPRHRHRTLYHFTHVMNLPSLIMHGLLCIREVQRLGLKYTSIAYDGIQELRAAMQVPCGPKGVIHDYVPLYFCKRSPMLYAGVYNKIAEQELIIYLEFPIDIMERYTCVFTNASANTGQAPAFFEDPADLDCIDWGAVATWRWGEKYNIPGRLPVKQAKMAEVLVHKRLTIEEVKRIIVFNEPMRNVVMDVFKRAGRTPPPVVVGGADFYYLDGQSTPVVGPYVTRHMLEQVTAEVVNGIGRAPSPKFAGLYPLRDALRADLRCLPETSELVGLQTGTLLPFESDLGSRTRRVVELLRKLPEYGRMPKVDQLLVELAAFLRDIGMGPKSRWAYTPKRKRTDPNHQLRALQMLKRILCEDVGTLRERSARVLCKLVCYHGLISDIALRGRRLAELEQSFPDTRELNMLLALDKAGYLAMLPDGAHPDLYEIYQARVETVLARLKQPRR